MYRLYIILSACLRNVYTHTHTTKEEKKMRDKCWPSQKKKKKSCFSGRGVIDMCVHYRNFVFSSFFICRLAAGPHNAIVYTVTLNRHNQRQLKCLISNIYIEIYLTVYSNELKNCNNGDYPTRPLPTRLA
jgi:hypothetical protein